MQTKKVLNIAQRARQLGKSRSYFYGMKNYSTEKYNYIISFEGETMIEKHEAYLKYLRGLETKLNALIDTLKQERKVFWFSKILFEEGVYGNRRNFSARTNHRMAVSYTRVKRVERIIEIYKREKGDKHMKYEVEASGDNRFTIWETNTFGTKTVVRVEYNEVKARKLAQLMQDRV